jgi:hypothetical protein
MSYPSSEPNLYDVVKASYKDKNTQTSSLGKYGYVRDNDLSNENQQAYYNPDKKKLIYSVTGTHNLADWGTDAYLAAGKIKDTNRYKSADEGLKKAKLKYGVGSASIYGHSLGGTIGGYIGGKGDTVQTLDKGATIGQKVRSNEKAMRTDGDVVSLLNKNSTNMTTVKNNHKIKTGNALIDYALNAYGAHDVNNIGTQTKTFI